MVAKKLADCSPAQETSLEISRRGDPEMVAKKLIHATLDNRPCSGWFIPATDCQESQGEFRTKIFIRLRPCKWPDFLYIFKRHIGKIHRKEYHGKY